MGVINADEYRRIEKLIQKVGIDNLNRYLIQKGHRPRNLTRNYKIIQYCLRHGPTATATLFNLSQNYPQHILRRYADAAEELLKIMNRETLREMYDPICPICHSECDEFMLDRNGEICGCNKCVSAVDVYEHIQDMDDSRRTLTQELNFEIEREFE